MIREGVTDKAVHFGAGRAINEYENFQACIAFGTPYPNEYECMDKAMVLFPEKQDRAEYFRHIAHAELEQTVQRVRLIHGGKTLVVIGRLFPEGIPGPDKLIDLTRKGQQIEKAYKRLKPFIEKNRFLIRNIAWCAGIYHKDDEKDAVFFRNKFKFFIEKVGQIKVSYLLKGITTSANGKGYLKKILQRLSYLRFKRIRIIS